MQHAQQGLVKTEHRKEHCNFRLQEKGYLLSLIVLSNSGVRITSQSLVRLSRCQTVAEEQTGLGAFTN